MFREAVFGAPVENGRLPPVTVMLGRGAMNTSDDPSQPDPTAHLAAIIESSDDAIISEDLDGIITSWNPAAERLFGWLACEAISKPITIIIPEDRWAEETRTSGRDRAWRDRAPL